MDNKYVATIKSGNWETLIHLERDRKEKRNCWYCGGSELTPYKESWGLICNGCGATYNFLPPYKILIGSQEEAQNSVRRHLKSFPDSNLHIYKLEELG